MASTSNMQFQLINLLGSLEFGKSFLNQPRGIAYRSSDSLLFIADSRNERVVAFTEDNKLAKIISHYGTKNGLAVMSNDQVLMSDELQVLILSPDLRLTRTIGCDDIQAGLTNYQGICVDEHDSIYVCDQANRQVKVYDSKNERVVAFTEDNKLAKIISHYGTKNGLAVMSNDQVLMSDELQVLILSTDLRLTRTIACDDIQAGLTNYQGICVDEHDSIYVCDQANRQVKVYDPKSGNIVRFFGDKNIFSSLAYCTATNGHIYITDPQGLFYSFSIEVFFFSFIIV